MGFWRLIISKKGFSFLFYSVFLNFLAFELSVFFKFFRRVFAKTYSPSSARFRLIELVVYLTKWATFFALLAAFCFSCLFDSFFLMSHYTSQIFFKLFFLPDQEFWKDKLNWYPSQQYPCTSFCCSLFQGSFSDFRCKRQRSLCSNWRVGSSPYLKKDSDKILH